jgi:hypothetical protein
LIRKSESLLDLCGAIAYRNNLEAVIAVNIETKTPIRNTKAKPLMTELLPK